jgi:hypothetical protein
MALAGSLSAASVPVTCPIGRVGTRLVGVKSASRRLRPSAGLASLGRRRPRLASDRYPVGCTQGDGDGGATTGGRSLQVMTFGKYGLSQLVPRW